MLDQQQEVTITFFFLNLSDLSRQHGMIGHKKFQLFGPTWHVDMTVMFVFRKKKKVVFGVVILKKLLDPSCYVDKTGIK